jgi:hypothetical protein
MEDLVIDRLIGGAIFGLYYRNFFCGLGYFSNVSKIECCPLTTFLGRRNFRSGLDENFCYLIYQRLLRGRILQLVL